jgi:hypothetical protein
VTAPQRWTAAEFAKVCEQVAAELRARAEAGGIAPSERLALFEWYSVIKDLVRVGAVRGGPGLAKPGSDLGGRGTPRTLRAVAR